VLSGVISTSYMDTESGIPGLRHIPILGFFFNSKGKRKTNTELLTFITPYLVNDYRDRYEILMKQKKRLEKYGDFSQDVSNFKINIGNE